MNRDPVKDIEETRARYKSLGMKNWYTEEQVDNLINEVVSLRYQLSIHRKFLYSIHEVISTSPEIVAWIRQEVAEAND